MPTFRKSSCRLSSSSSSPLPRRPIPGIELIPAGGRNFQLDPQATPSLMNRQNLNKSSCRGSRKQHLHQTCLCPALTRLSAAQ